jgi:hypothetical protein
MGTFSSGVEPVPLGEVIPVGRAADQGLSSCRLPHGFRIDAPLRVLDHAQMPGPDGPVGPSEAPGRPARSGDHAGG